MPSIIWEEASTEGTVDVTDRSGRIVGHVMVDNPSVAVTGPLTDGQLRASSVPVQVKNFLIPGDYDEVDLSYTGSDLTNVIYKKATVTVATLTLTYSSGILQNVVRS